MSTGQVDSKFGSAVETGQAEEITAFTLDQPHIALAGFHCHVGSQVFAEDVYERACAIMIGFIADIKARCGYAAEMLNIGGGFGVRYVESDPHLDIASKLGEVAAAINKECSARGIAVPKILMEPGRSIVANAGLTLYTAGTVKIIPGYKSYVSIDGGMPDNPRYALYGSKYTCLAACRMNEPTTFRATIAGRCCESGDLIQENVPLPETVGRGDLIAVCTTGAYNYSMASNYNRIPRPPIVMLKKNADCSRGDGAQAYTSYVAVRRETIDDLISLDV